MEELCSIERGSGVHQRRKKERRDVQSATTNFDEVSRELNCSFELICVMDDIVVGVYGVVRLLEVGGVESMGGGVTGLLSLGGATTSSSSVSAFVCHVP